MVRTPKIDKNGMKKGVWSQEEDDKLRAYVLKYGHFNWRQLPKFAGLSRCGKSCRLRWLNYLRQNVKRGDYTKEEEDLIINLRDQLGNRWSVIAAKLPGRTDNEIKNYWHSNLKKRVKQNPATSEVMDQSNDQTNVLSHQNSEGNPLFPESSSSGLSSLSFDYTLLSGINQIEEDCITSFESYSLSNPNEFHIQNFPCQANQERELTQENFPESSSSGLSSLSFDYTLLSGINQIEEDCITSFESYSLSNPNEFHIQNFPCQANQERELTQEKFPESSFNDFSSLYFDDDEQLSGINRFKDYSIITPLESYSELIGNFWTEPFLLDESHNQSDFLQASTEGGFMPPLCSYYDDNI